MNSVPVIRMELEGFKIALLHAMSDHQLQIDQNVQAAVEKFCTPENLAKIIEDKSHTIMREAIESEVRDFFTYGDGRKAIRAAVQKKLKEDINGQG